MTTDLAYIENALREHIRCSPLVNKRGRVVKVTGTIIKATGIKVKIGDICILQNPGEKARLQTEVVGFDDRNFLLTPLGRMIGISSSTEVIGTGDQYRVPVGDQLLGRVIDGLGNVIDAKGDSGIDATRYKSIYAEPPNPLKRKMITRPLCLGVRAIDAMLTCCEGQRMGIFAGAGCGKSTLLAMIARATEADVIVLSLIGERGREVREFIEDTLGEEGMRRAVVVVSTSDRPAMERMKAAFAATSIAEYFRDQGMRVLLMLDSVTRFARAQRELGLAAGEPPTRRGFPPSLFTNLPLLVERAGQSEAGSITAIYTVLVEGDDMNEPVADEMKSLLDGHIVLSRDLAAGNHYPAIDVLSSVSRVMNNVVQAGHVAAAGRVRSLLAKYKEIELLLRIGEYSKGSDPVAEEAIKKIDAINAFLKQEFSEKADFSQTLEQLSELAGI